MIDTRSVAQQVQEQVTAAVQKGQERARKRQGQVVAVVTKGQEQVRKHQGQVLAVVSKGQEHVRKHQEQVRKGQDAVAGAIRTGSQIAKAVPRPSMPAQGLRVPPLSTLTSPTKLRASAQELAGQVRTAQRGFAEKAFQAASPLVSEGVARISEMVSTLQTARKAALSGEHKAGSAAGDTAAQPTEAATEAKTEQTVTELHAVKASKPRGGKATKGAETAADIKATGTHARTARK